MASAKKKTVVLGPEYDEGTRRALKATLSRLNAAGGSQKWGVGGSQEIETLQVLIDGEPLSIESETYIGLTITGDADLVDRVAALVQEQMRVV